VNSVRAWILLFGSVSFLVGVAAGALVVTPDAPQGPLDPFGAYGDRMEQHYSLGNQRSEALAVVLASYREELDHVRSRHLPTYHAAMEPELSALGVRYGVMIRDKVLPPSARRQYVHESEGLLQIQDIPR
jgi:hypothetical protein